jgi:hypothetical protein
MANGIYLAQDAHTVNVLPPVDVTGGKTAQPFSMAGAAHATIILQIGVSAAALTGVTVNACTDVAGAGATAIGFDLFKQETAGTSNDVLSVRTPITAAGFAPSANDDIFYVLEIDGTTLPPGSDYVELAIANGANSVIASAVAVLSGLRYAGESNPTATV